MSNPTTPFGWQMPTNTDLVTDLPADFEVFGQAVATSMQDLLGGTTGQVLAKASNTDMDFVWSADAAGMTNPMTTTGDVIYSSPNSTPVRLGIGTTGQVLTVASGVPSWTTLASGATFSGARVTKSASQSLTSGTWTIVTFNTEQFDVDGYHSIVTNTSRLTIPTGKNGYFLIYGSINWATGSAGTRQIIIVKNGTDIILNDNAATSDTYPATRQVSLISSAVATDYFELNVRQDSGSTKNINGGSDACNFMITYLGA